MDGDDDDREQRLRNRGHALTDLSAMRRRFYIQCIELLSGGDVVLEVTGSRVRRHVIVHRDLRAATRQCILHNGWDFAVTRIPPGAKSDEFARLSGWSSGPGRLWVPANTLNSREFRAFRSTFRDLGMLKGKHEFKGQDRRRATLTGARLNGEVIRHAVAADDAPNRKIRVCAYTLPPNFGLEPSGATWEPDDIELPRHDGPSWIVSADPDIAAQIKRETYKCDAIARNLLKPTETQRERIARLNEHRRALLESLVGKSTYVPPPTMSHPAADMGCQTAALDMVFTEEAGFSIWERRNRHNSLLEPTEKFTRRGKRYRPGKAAGPGRRLTGEALIAAIARLRPAKKHEKPYPRGTETGMFDKCRRAGRKQLQDYTAHVDGNEPYRHWDLIGTPDAAAIADRNRLRPLINIPEGWSRNSFAEEVMSLRSKKTGWEWSGEVQFADRIVYGRHSLNNPIRERPTPV